MLSDFCRKHWTARAVCGCLIAALVTPTIASVLKGDPQAKLPAVQVVGTNLTAAATGTAQTSSSGSITIVADATISGQRYVSVWPEQRRKAVVGPTGPSDNISYGNTVLTGTGPPRVG